jgi:hypothetical protein
MTTSNVGIGKTKFYSEKIGEYYLMAIQCTRCKEIR